MVAVAVAVAVVVAVGVVVVVAVAVGVGVVVAVGVGVAVVVVVAVAAGVGVGVAVGVVVVMTYLTEQDDAKLYCRSVGLEDDGYAFGTVLDAHLAGSANVRKQIPALVEAAVLKERERIIQVVKVFGGAGWNRERLEDLIINPSPKEPTNG